jgi:hypothetical protein
MPNWCCNTVVFYAEDAVMKNIQNLFRELSKLEARTMHGQLPEFVKVELGWLHEIDMEGDILYYQTKWAPNLEVMLQVAAHFKCDFKFTYDEPGMLLFGEFEYFNGKLKERSIEEAERDQMELNEENYTYRFEGQIYESEYDIYEILLERKGWTEVTI